MNKRPARKPQLQTKKSSWRRAVKFILLSLLFLILLLIAASGWLLNTGSGLTFTAQLIQKFANSETNGVRLQNLSGGITDTLRLGQLELYDEQGVWLRGKNTEVSLNFSDLLVGKIRVTHIAAEDIIVYRQPVAQPNTTPSNTNPMDYLPMATSLRSINVEKVELQGPVLGRNQTFTILLSKAESTEPGLSYDINARTLEQPYTRLNGNFLIGDIPKLKLVLSEAPGGLVGKTLNISSDSSIEAALSIVNKNGNWLAAGSFLRDDEELMGLEAYMKRQPDGIIKWGIPELRSFGSLIEARGNYNPNNQYITFTSTTKMDEVESLFTLFGIPGSGDAVTKFFGKGPLENVQATLNVKGGSLELYGEQWQNVVLKANMAMDMVKLSNGQSGIAVSALALNAAHPANGRELSLKGTGGWQEQQVALESLIVNYGELKARGTLQYSLDDNHIDANITVPPSPLPLEGMNAITSELNIIAKGDMEKLPLQLKGKASGLLSVWPELAQLLGNDATFESDATWRGDEQKLELNSLTLKSGPTDAEASGTFDVADNAYAGDLSLTTHLADASDLKLKAKTLADADNIIAKDISISGAGVKGSGDVNFKTATQLVDAVLELQATSLQTLGELIGQPLQGSGSLSMALSGKSGTQGATLDAKLADAGYAGTMAGGIEANASLPNVNDLDTARANVLIRDLIAGSAVLSETTLKATPGGSPQNRTLSLELNTRGNVNGEPLSLASRMSVNQDGQQQSLRITTLTGEYAGLPLTLQQAATLSAQGNDVTLSPMVVTLADGTLRAGGTIKNNRVDLNLTAENVPHELLGPAAASQLAGADVDAELHLRGTAASPTMEATAKAVYSDMQTPLAIVVDGNYAKGTTRFSVATNIENGEANVQGSFPMQFALQPFAFTLSDTTPLKGNATIDMPMAALDNILAAYGHKLEGHTTGNFALTGTVYNPVINGSAQLADGSYKHLDHGICLPQFNAEVKIANQQLDASLSAQGEKEGVMAMGAESNLSSALPGRANVELKDFPLLCGEMASGLISGKLDLTAKDERSLLAGRLEPAPLNINIPGGRAGANIPVIRVRDPNAGERPAPLLSKIDLDVEIDMPRRVFVEGRGLDAEFGGNLKLSHTAAEPEILGNLNTIRGTMVLLDRTLTITKGQLKFLGRIPPSPYLDVKTVTEADGTDITIALSGSASDPDIELSSSPSLPEDEVLSLFLFGREVSEITPFQAIQLAQSVRELAGFSDGPGVISQASDLIGVDSLSVDQGTEGGTSVTAGKYITDKVHVGVTQGTAVEDREVITTIELTPNISAEASVDGAGNQGVGGEYHYDY